jgi:hypothetical protein
MHLEKYHLKAEPKLTRFEFISEGPNGAIRKLIEFQETNTSDVFNLAFGDRDSQTGGVDDLAISNNGDTDKVLATVVAALYAFFDQHPDVFVYAEGSTKARTRLYRMGISRFFAEMEADFYLYGRIGEEFVPFELGRNYEGFLAQRKNE